MFWGGWHIRWWAGIIFSEGRYAVTKPLFLMVRHLARSGDFFWVTLTNVAFLDISVAVKNSIWFFKGVSGNRLRSSVEISDRFFLFNILCLTGFCIRDKSSEGHTTCLFEIFELFFIIRPDVPKKYCSRHSCLVVVFQAQILSFTIQLVKIVLAYVTRVVYYTMFSSHYINRAAAAPQVLKKRKVTAKQRKLTFPFPIVSQTKVASLLQSWTLRAKWIGSKNRGLSRPVRSLDMGY